MAIIFFFILLHGDSFNLPINPLAAVQYVFIFSFACALLMRENANLVSIVQWRTTVLGLRLWSGAPDVLTPRALYLRLFLLRLCVKCGSLCESGKCVWLHMTSTYAAWGCGCFFLLITRDFLMGEFLCLSVFLYGCLMSSTTRQLKAHSFSLSDF